jgi:hypothetical protein
MGTSAAAGQRTVTRENAPSVKAVRTPILARGHGVCWLLAFGACTCDAHAALPDYTQFELQARTNLIQNDAGYNLPPGSSFNSISAHIDDQARVSFPVQVVPMPPSSVPGVWFGSHGAGTIVTTGPLDVLISSETHHNADGVIVYTLFDTNNVDGIYRYDPIALTATRVSTSPLFPNSWSNARITGAGAIGYQAVFSGGRGLASTSGGSLLHAVDQGLDPGSPWTYLYTPTLNNQRVHFAKVATSADFTTATEIRSFDSAGTSQRLVANQGTLAGSPIRQFDNGLAVNDLGVVAFVASRASDQRRAVYRSDGVNLTELAVANPAGPITAIEFFRPAINNAGLVVFRATDAGGQALFVSDGTGVKRVIGRGDALGTDLGPGQIGQNNAADAVFSGAPAINADGDIAFIAALHPVGNDQVEWGSGVYVAYAVAVSLFADGFE